MSKERLPLNGRKALVTGAGRGIGRAVALELAQQGADLVLVSRTQSELEQVQLEVEKSGRSCHIFSFDLMQLNELEALSEAVSGATGFVDILVNNAGVYQTDRLEDESNSDWQDALDLNLSAPYRLCKLFSSHMKEQNWGRIVNISSISGQKAEAFGTAYSASKFGLIGLTEALALELAPFGTTVNAVCPGWVDTKMAREQLEDPQWCQLNNLPQEQSVEIAKLSVPQGRLMEPEEIAYLVAFLCHNRAGAITGQAINICGGLSIT